MAAYAPTPDQHTETEMTQLQVIDLASNRAAAFIRKGQRAWTAIKTSAQEQRALWLEIGVALNYGKEMHPSNQAFSKWCNETGFGDISASVRSNALWFAKNEASCTGCKRVGHPTHIRQWFNDQQPREVLPKKLRSTPQPVRTASLTKETAAKINKRAFEQAAGTKAAPSQIATSGHLPRSTASTLMPSWRRQRLPTLKASTDSPRCN